MVIEGFTWLRAVIHGYRGLYMVIEDYTRLWAVIHGYVIYEPWPGGVHLYQ